MRQDLPRSSGLRQRREWLALVVLLVLPVAAVGLAAGFGLIAIVRSVLGTARDLDLPGFLAVAAPGLAFGFVALAAILIYFRFEYGWRLQSFVSALALNGLVLIGARLLWPH